MQIGSARVSRGDFQELDPQVRAATDASCSISYQEEDFRKRTMNGLADAGKTGKHIGRRRALSPQQRTEVIECVENGQGSPAQFASLFRVSRSTVQRVIREHRAKVAG